MKKLFQFSIIILSTGGIVAAVYATREALSPSDWVDVRVDRIPKDVTNLYLVAQKDGKVFPLNWYLSKVTAHIVDPKIAGEQWYWTVGGDERKGDLQWVEADAYGILARVKSGKWVVWWLKPKQISGPPSSRFLTGAGGRVWIQASGIESAELAPQALLDQVDHETP